MAERKKIKIGITHGDINGIGYEVILKTFQNKEMLNLCLPIIYGSSKIAAYYKKILDLPSVTFNKTGTPDRVYDKQVNIIDCVNETVSVDIGNPTVVSGKAAYQSLERATKDLLHNKIDAIVTAPIGKGNIQSDKFNFTGHTEYFQSKAKTSNSLMLMVGENIKIATLTNHIPLNQVHKMITKENILNKLFVLNKALIEDFSINKPKIALLSFNPHSGDNGLIGKEEKEIIAPAIQEANNRKLLAFGPYSADGFFGADNYKKFDAILAMYHDQGLIPFKVLSEGGGVNYTAGLPFVRTSPAHGTGYDIAGKNKATPTSFRNAIYTAIEVYKSRITYDSF